MKEVTTFTVVWNDEGSGGNVMNVIFYRPTLATGERSFGDYTIFDKSYDTAYTGKAFVVSAEENGDIIAPPDYYEKRWDDAGSGADWDGSLHKPMPQPGYECLGGVSTRDHEYILPPNSKLQTGATGTGSADNDVIACVKKEYIKVTATPDYNCLEKVDDEYRYLGVNCWADRYSGAHEDVSIYIISTTVNQLKNLFLPKSGYNAAGNEDVYTLDPDLFRIAP